ncbi:PilZ domain-containing protein [Thermodesulfobacteriota bacterium]
MDDRRKFHRVPFATEAEINFAKATHKVDLLDISLQGALVQGKGAIPLKKGDPCQLSIHLLDSEITMQFDVSLVHRQGNNLGFRFTSEDTETMTHLRRLLELNIGSSDVLDREISFWLKGD